jgi:hypothetical protein
MYGTVMIGKAREGRAEEMVAVMRAWMAERGPTTPGFTDEWMLVADDGVTVVAGVRFASKEDYLRLADDGQQAAWWAEHAAPLLDGDPTWIDGHWPV